MTSHRGLPFGSSDDAKRAVVAPLLADLRTELLVMPREEIVDDHLAMMAFEKQILATPRFVQRVRRSPLAKPRRTAFVMACVCATIASCGLSAAGALPEPLQHLTDTIAHTLGVPKPHDTPKAPHSAAAGALPTTTTPASPRVEGPTVPSAPKAAPTATTHHKRTASHPTVVTPSTEKPIKPPPPYVPPRPSHPSHRITPKKPNPTPTKNSDNTPPGYPTYWRSLAITAATARLNACSLAQSLSETGCPQLATADGVNTEAQSVQWLPLNDPSSLAVAVAQTKHLKGGGATTTVTVYEPYEMYATYTEPGSTRTFVAYSGGIARATMTWSGSTFENVSFSPGSAAGHLLPGVTVASFARPDAATDSAALAAVVTALGDCNAVMAPAPNATPNCADTTSSPNWSVVGDPTQGAVVTFDRSQGNFTVTGAYSMTDTPADGTAVSTVSGHYTATLFFDGQAFEVLSITAGP